MIKRLQQDKDKLVKIGLRAAKQIGVRTRIAVIRAYKNSEDIAQAVLLELAKLESLICDAMIAAHLSGRLRSVLTAAEYIRNRNKALGPYDAATEFAKKRLDVDESDLSVLKTKYGDTATDVTRQASKAVELKVKKAAQEIIEEGMHVREGIKHLREAMADTGIEPANPWLLETLVRTQIEVAYGAGRWNANQDPDIQEILWGYEYVTVGDDRVRPSHEALEGIKLPKDDPMWDEIWPPNGFNCRCDVLEVFEDDSHKIVEVLETKEVDGKIVVPGADEGWGINHGKVYEDMIGLAA